MGKREKFPDSSQPWQIIRPNLFESGVFDKASSEWIMHELTIKWHQLAGREGESLVVYLGNAYWADFICLMIIIHL